MDMKVSQFVYSIFKESFYFVNQYLSNYSLFSELLSQERKVKEDNNVQYNFDIELDNLVKRKINKFQITGRIFSEESLFFDNGEKKYRVIYDPFCNSSLASKSIYEAAIGISVFSYDYKFITSAVLDFQTGIYGIVEDGRTHFYQIQTGKEFTFNFKKEVELKDSWVVLTLENKEERKGLDRVENLLKGAGRILVGSGHIYWLRLAAGIIHLRICLIFSSGKPKLVKNGSAIFAPSTA